MEELVTTDIIKTRRQYFMNKVKAPLIKAITTLCMRYPAPTRENCVQPNTHVLMDIWDEFFKYEDNPAHPDPKSNPWFGREQLFKAMERIMLCEYEHDPYYRDRMSWFVEKIVQKYQSGEWTKRLPILPDRRVCWNEPVDKEELRRILDEVSVRR